MKKINVTQPYAMATPFAKDVYTTEGTSDFEIPIPTSTSASDSCVLDDGFLPITSTDLDDGGIAPERKNFNGMFYLSTDQRFYLQNGGFITYNPDVATAIGGYPQDAILDFIDSNGQYRKVRSLIDDNTNNFVTDETLIDGTNWEEIKIGGSARSIGEIVISITPLTDAELHPIDGALLQYGSYKDCIDYYADLYDSGNYSAIFTTEASWQSEVATYGVCGKFVYDSVNKTLRLPKITGFIEGTNDITKLGDLVEAGLPNITGLLRATGVSSGAVLIQEATGAFSSSEEVQGGSGGHIASTSGNYYVDININASQSNTIYGNSTAVQPQAIKVFYYIVVATTTKTSIQVDIDEIATDLNGKADVDLTNVNNTGTSRGASWALPSNTYDDLTLGASGATYTAPANGWLFFSKVGTATDQYMTLGNGNFQTSAYASFNGAWVQQYIPCKKGDAMYVGYSLGGSTNFFRFYYAVGSESEAS